MHTPIYLQRIRLLPVSVLALLLVVGSTLGLLVFPAPSSNRAAFSATPRPRLTVLVRFAAPLEGLGVDEEEVVAKIEADLRAELGTEILIAAQHSQDPFLERFLAALAEIEGQHDVAAKRQQVHDQGQAFLDANQSRIEPLVWDATTAAALQSYENALQAFSAELAETSNLAALPPGSVGLLLTPAPGYGGQTAAGASYPDGERWSLLYTGLAAADFVTPDDPERSRALVLSYLANAAKHQIGLQFGLQPNQLGLEDAMHGDVDRVRGEHLVRDSQPVHFNAQDRQRLGQRLREWGIYPVYLPLVAGGGTVPVEEALDQAEPEARVLRTVRSAEGWPAIISTIGEGLGVITGAAEVGGWIAGLLSGGDAAKITKGFPKADFDVELGLASQLDYEVEYRFVDHALIGSEYAFFEVYVVFNNQVIYYHRFPESGYITNPDKWFDDSHSQKFQGSVYLGAEKWPCKNVTDEVKIHAVLWDDTFRWHSKGRSKWVGTDGHGKEVNGTPEGYYRTAGLTKRAEDSEVMKVTVMNPYYVDIKKNYPLTLHHSAGLSELLEFDAVMNYSLNYATIDVFVPEPREANVTINPLVSQEEWVFNLTKGELQFTFKPGPLAHDSKTIGFAGRHGDPEQHHPNLIVSYEDDWGASVVGTNRIFQQQGNEKVPHPFTWAATFRPQPNAVGCTPLPFAVNCVDPHGTMTTSSAVLGMKPTSRQVGEVAGLLVIALVLGATLVTGIATVTSEMIDAEDPQHELPGSALREEV